MQFIRSTFFVFLMLFMFMAVPGQAQEQKVNDADASQLSDLELQAISGFAITPNPALIGETVTFSFSFTADSSDRNTICIYHLESAGYGMGLGGTSAIESGLGDTYFPSHGAPGAGVGDCPASTGHYVTAWSVLSPSDFADGGDTLSISFVVPPGASTAIFKSRQYNLDFPDPDDALNKELIIHYEVTASVQAGNGSISPTSQPVGFDGTASFTVTPDSGWSLGSVTGDPCNPLNTGGQDWQADNIVEDCAVETIFTIDSFSIGGTVAGLEGSGLELALNGEVEILAITGNGIFEFETEIDHDSDYAVTVASQPTDPRQTCAIANSTGTVNAADVTDINVDCLVIPDEIFSDRFQN